jgi:hypothetical protein
MMAGVFSVSPAPKNAKDKSTIPLAGLMLGIISWDLICLGLLGQAKLFPGIFYIGKRLVYFLVFATGVRVSKLVPRFTPVVYSLLLSSPVLGASILLEQRLHAGELDYRASGMIKQQEASTAYFCVFILGLCMAVWPHVQSKLKQTLLLVVLAAALQSLLATGTKGGLILFGLISAGLLVKQGKSSVVLFILLIPMMAMGWAYTPVSIQQRFDRIQNESLTAWDSLSDGVEGLQGGGDSVADRLIAANYVLNTLIPESPIWGSGTGAHGLGFVDDDYLTEWVYHGLVGLLLWLAFQIALGQQLWIATRVIVHPIERGVANGMLLIFLSYSVGCLTADMFYLIRPCEAFFLIAGLVVGRSQDLGYHERGRDIVSAEKTLERNRIPQFVPRSKRLGAFDRIRRTTSGQTDESTPAGRGSSTDPVFRSGMPE